MVAIGLVVGLLLVGCQPDDPAALRAEIAASSDGDIVVGVAWPFEARRQDQFREGLDLAVEEINDRGGVLNRPLRLVYSDDHSDVKEGRIIAQKYVNQEE